jgi:ribosome modulation factor
MDHNNGMTGYSEHICPFYKYLTTILKFESNSK